MGKANKILPVAKKFDVLPSAYFLLSSFNGGTIFYRPSITNFDTIGLFWQDIELDVPRHPMSADHTSM